MHRIPPLAALLWLSCSLASAAAQSSPDGGLQAMIQQCPEVKTRLDDAFSRNPDFDSIGDVVNKRIAQCEYYKDLSVSVGRGYDAVRQCQASGAIGIDARQAELRTILRRIRNAAVQYCD